MPVAMARRHIDRAVMSVIMIMIMMYEQLHGQVAIVEHVHGESEQNHP